MPGPAHLVLPISGTLSGTGSIAGTVSLLANASGRFTGSGTIHASATGNFPLKHYRKIAKECRTLANSALSIPIQFDNQPGDFSNIPVWARVATDFDTTQQLEVGNLFRTIGETVITVYASLETGDGGLLVIADQIKNSFREVRSGIVSFFSPYVARIGRDSNGYALRVHCPYRATEAIPKVATSSNGVLSFAAICSTLRNRFFTSFSSLPIQFDNQSFEPVPTQAWCRFSILPGATSKVGHNTWRTPGVAKANIFGVLEVGDSETLSIADNIAEMYRALTDSGVTLRTPSVKIMGRSGNWWQVNVTCPFYADEVV